MNWKAHKQLLLKNTAFRKALKENELEYRVSREIIKARIHKGLTQKELARKLNTKQSAISRVENAGTIPSLSFLKKLAEVLDCRLYVEFK